MSAHNCVIKLAHAVEACTDVVLNGRGERVVTPECALLNGQTMREAIEGGLRIVLLLEAQLCFSHHRVFQLCEPPHADCAGADLCRVTLHTLPDSILVAFHHETQKKSWEANFS